MNTRNKLTAHILMGLSLATLSCWSFADKLDNQSLPTNTALEQTEQLDAFVAWDDKLKSILTEQLVANGYDEKEMAADADAVNTIKDKAEFAKAKIGFYSKYQTLALQGLRGVAALAKSTEADTVITKMAKVLQSHPVIPDGGVPGSIAFIYEQIAVSVLELGDSPCITPMTRLGCLFALLGNRECAYIPPSPAPSSIIPVAWRFPSAPVADPSDLIYGLRYFSYWDDPANIVYQWVSSSDSEGDIVRSAAPVGFRWPLKASDHTMCVEMNIAGYNLVNDALSRSPYPDIIGGVNAYVPLPGYLRESASWSMTLNGYGAFRAGQPASMCSFNHDAISDTFSDDVDYDIYANPHSRACWFRNLEEVYRDTVTARPFEVNPSDPDTWFAASVDITSNASVNQSVWGTTYGGANVGITLNSFGILITRDR